MVIQFHSDRQVPRKVAVEMRTQPPIFSGVPWRKRILSQSYQPSSAV